MKQVDRGAYAFECYSGEDRFASYYVQLREVFACAPSSVLEVGTGEHVLGNYLKNNTDIAYTSLDIAEDLSPDIVGDVRKLPFPDNSFDVACAFEVLEHLPFDDFEQAIGELMRVSKKQVIISLPHFGPPIKFLLKVPFFPEARFAFKIPFPRKHMFNGQHYWEIGKRGYPAHRIRAILARFGTLRKEFTPFGNQYHHFFVLEKNHA